MAVVMAVDCGGSCAGSGADAGGDDDAIEERFINGSTMFITELPKQRTMRTAFLWKVPVPTNSVR